MVAVAGLRRRQRDCGGGSGSGSQSADCAIAAFIVRQAEDGRRIAAAQLHLAQPVLHALVSVPSGVGDGGCPAADWAQLHSMPDAVDECIASISLLPGVLCRRLHQRGVGSCIREHFEVIVLVVAEGRVCVPHDRRWLLPWARGAGERWSRRRRVSHPMDESVAPMPGVVSKVPFAV